MPSLKAIRKRISSTKSTQKITRAMKMISAARLRRAQQRITELRPFALKTAQVLRDVALRTGGEADTHPLLERREEQNILLIVTGSDRGQAGGFNAQINRAAERMARDLIAQDKQVVLVTIGRKTRDYFRRRRFEVLEELPGVNERLDLGHSNEIAAKIVDWFIGENTVVRAEADTEVVADDAEHDGHAPAEVPLLEAHEGDTETAKRPRFDAVYFIYNEFKSAMTQKVAIDRLLPVEPTTLEDDGSALDFIYEPSRKGLLDRLLPLYVQITVFRALLESVASEHGARMTAMDAATNNAKDIISALTLDYNRARQAAITKELMEIISGAEAQK